MKNQKIRPLHLLLAVLLFCCFHEQLISQEPKLIEKIEAAPGELKIAYEKWQLANGLKIFVHEDHSDPIVHVEVDYHVGSNRERPGRSGFAHFFEHMMFQGSEHVGDEQHFKIIREGGGSNNGYTTSDETVYLQTVPSNQLEVALWLEADRMGFLLDAVTQEKFEVQRDAVKNEKSQNFLNRPYAMSYEIMGQSLYPPNHPYSWPTIGYTDDLDKADLTDLKDFFIRWYGPNNATLIVSGDVETKKVIELADKYYGSIKKGPNVTKQKVPPVLLPIDRYGSYIDNIYLPLTIMTFPTVHSYHRDEPALDVLASIMGQGNNSNLYQKFVKTEKASSAEAGHPTRELAGEFTIVVLSYPPEGGLGEIEEHFNTVEKDIREAIDEFEINGITNEAVERTKTRIISQKVNIIESVAGKAMILGKWERRLGRVYNLNDELQRYKNVTEEDVSSVFKKYIKNKHVAIVNVYPKHPMSKDSVVSNNPNANLGNQRKEMQIYKEGHGEWNYQKPVDNFDRSVKPTPGLAKSPVIPDYYQSELSNGLKIIGTKSSEIPKVTLLLEMEGGDWLTNDPEMAGISALTASLLNEGTENYTTEKISAELDKLGSSIRFYGSSSATSVNVQCFSDQIDPTIKLLEEKLLRPRFSEEEFKRVKKQQVESIKSDRKEANYLARIAIRKVLYPNSIFGSYPTEKTVNGFTIDEVKDFYAKYYSPNITSLVIVGDVDKDIILEKLDFLNSWNNKNVEVPQFKGEDPTEKTTIYLVHKERSPQSVISAAHHSIPYDAYGDYFKNEVANFALGGQFNSRLNLNLREDKGYTYGIRSYFSGNKSSGLFGVSTSVKRSSTAESVSEIMKELKNYVSIGITQEEMDFTKSSMLNIEALKYEHTFAKAGFLNRIVEYNLPEDFTARQIEILKDINIAGINAMVKNHIKPDQLAIVVVGDKYLIKKPLSKLGYGKVEEISVD